MRRSILRETGPIASRSTTRGRSVRSPCGTRNSGTVGVLDPGGVALPIAQKDYQADQVHAVLKARLVVQQARFADLTRTDLAAFNRLLQEKGVAGITVPVVK